MAAIKRTVSAIDAQLLAKGLTKTDPNPGVYVRYHIALGVQKRVSGFGVVLFFARCVVHSL
jgi:hypothetical protein